MGRKRPLGSGVLHTLELDEKSWHQSGVRWSTMPRFGHCNRVVTELSRPGYEMMGPGKYSLRDPTRLSIEQSAEEAMLSPRQSPGMSSSTDRFDPMNAVRCGMPLPETLQPGYEHMGPGCYPQAHDRLSLIQDSKNCKMFTGELSFNTMPKAPSAAPASAPTSTRLVPLEASQHAWEATEANLLHYDIEDDRRAWRKSGVRWSSGDRGLHPSGYRPHTARQPDSTADRFFAYEKMPVTQRVANIHVHGETATPVNKMGGEVLGEPVTERKPVSLMSKVPRFSPPKDDQDNNIGPGFYDQIKWPTYIGTRTAPNSKVLFGSNMTSKVSRFTSDRVVGGMQPFFGALDQKLVQRRRKIMQKEERSKEQALRRKEEERLCQVFIDSF